MDTRLAAGALGTVTVTVSVRGKRRNAKQEQLRERNVDLEDVILL
jgi:hypothetical protein